MFWVNFVLKSFLSALTHTRNAPVKLWKKISIKFQQEALIDLVTVFDAILTSRQTREKLQCLYENLLSNNFRRTSVPKKT